MLRERARRRPGEAPTLLDDVRVRRNDAREAASRVRRRDDEREPTVSVVIPALNEAENLPLVLPRIPPECEVVLVDGRSTDATVVVARELRPDLVLVEEPRLGKGAALRAGFAAASGDVIVALDADGSTDPVEIPRFVDALRAGADYAKGSRFLRGGGTTDMTRFRRAGNWGLVRLVRLLHGGKYTDLCYGYNAFWADVAPQLRLNGDGFEIETMMNIRALKAGLRIVEVPSFEHERFSGIGHLKTFTDGWRVLKTILHELRRVAHAEEDELVPSDADPRVFADA